MNTPLDTTLEEKRGELRFRAHDALLKLVQDAGGADIVLVLVNCPEPAAGGTALLPSGDRPKPIPAPTISAHPDALRLAMHALGHSLGLLNDEFSASTAFCPGAPDAKLPPGGPNVVNEADLSDESTASMRQSAPWRHFLDLPGAKKHDWLHEGAGTRPKGVYRAWNRCRMRELDAPFCPVCCEELAKAIQALCGTKWDDQRYHHEHPLTLWKE